MVVFLYREEYYLLRSPKPNDPDWESALMAARNKATLLLRKNRQGEAPRDITVFCDIKCCVFRDRR